MSEIQYEVVRGEGELTHESRPQNTRCQANLGLEGLTELASLT